MNILSEKLSSEQFSNFQAHFHSFNALPIKIYYALKDQIIFQIHQTKRQGFDLWVGCQQ